MSNSNDSTTYGPTLTIASLRASVAMGSMAVAMGRTQRWMTPGDRAALDDLEHRRLPEMKRRLARLTSA